MNAGDEAIPGRHATGLSVCRPALRCVLPEQVVEWVPGSTDLRVSAMGLFRRQKGVTPSRAALLTAVPVRHPSATERTLPNGSVELSVPVEKRRLARWLTGDNKPIMRKFELDPLGAEVWRMADGRATVREMIEAFAASHQLNLRESEVSMLAYLRTLVSRSIMVIAIHEPQT